MIALFVALGGPAWAKKKLIDGSTIKRNTITSRQVQAGSLSRTDLNDAAIRFLQRTPDRAISSSQIATGAITGDKLAPASVGTTAVADNTLTGLDIAPGSLGNAVFAADSVGFEELAESAVGKRNMRAASVGRSEIQTGGVQSEELGVTLASLAFDPIPADTCQSKPFVPATPGGDLTRTFVLVGQTATWPGDTVTLSARPTDAATLTFTACNLGTSTATPGAQMVPYAALLPPN
jgi:hypothetical protein